MTVKEQREKRVVLKGAEAVVNILKLEGLEFLSCFPDSPLINPAAEAGIRTLLVRNERVAVNIADGYTRVTNGRKIGVCTMQAGVGIENAFAGVAQAYSDSTPILVLPEQERRRRFGVNPIYFDALHNFRNVTKWAECINFADRVPELMRRAFTFLRTGRPGPVLLEIPRDVAEEEFRNPKFVYKPVKGWKTAGDPHDIQVAVKAILAAKNPIIHAGQGVLYAEAWNELQEFAELVQAPVMTTMTGKSAFPENHPLALGYGGYTATKMVDHFLRKADLVFSVGAGLTKWWMGASIPIGKIIIQSTVDEYDINKDYQIDYVLFGDAKLVLRQMVEEVNLQGGGGQEKEVLVEEIRSIKEKWLAEWMPKLTSGEKPINPYRIFWDLMHTVDRRNTIVTHDSGHPRDELAPFWETLIPRGYIGWGHMTTLGFSLGAVMGAKLAAPEKLVINFMGDAAFGMTGMDFETAVREKIPILTIVLNNSVMSGYTKSMPSTSVLSGDYAGLAEALGGYSERVEDPDEIIPAFKQAMKSVESGNAALLNMVTKEELDKPLYWPILD